MAPKVTVGTGPAIRAGPALKVLAGETYWSFTVGAAKTWPGCVAWQVDGNEFTETFSFGQ